MFEYDDRKYKSYNDFFTRKKPTLPGIIIFISAKTNFPFKSAKTIYYIQ